MQSPSANTMFARRAFGFAGQGGPDLAAGAVKGCPADRSMLHSERDSGRADLYLESARKAESGRADDQRPEAKHRIRSMRTRIRALVHDAVGASAVTLNG
jgi:hypothetical protein